MSHLGLGIGLRKNAKNISMAKTKKKKQDTQNLDDGSIVCANSNVKKPIPLVGLV